MAYRFDYYKHIKTLGMKVARKEPFLQETSCMSNEARELIAYLEMYKIIYSEDKQGIEEIDKIFKPCIALLGRANWKRDILTDLGLNLGPEKSMASDVSKFIHGRKKAKKK